LGIALRSLSALINAREDVYVSLTSEYLHIRMETREKQGRTRTRLSSSTSSVIRLKIRIGITVDLRNRMRKWQRWIVRVRIVFFTENNFVGFYDTISSLRSICPICHVTLQDADSSFKSNDASFSHLILITEFFLNT